METTTQKNQLLTAARTAIIAVTVVAWIVAVASFVNAVLDVSAFPAVAQDVLGLLPDPDTTAGLVVRFGAVAVVIAGG